MARPSKKDIFASMAFGATSTVVGATPYVNADGPSTAAISFAYKTNAEAKAQSSYMPTYVTTSEMRAELAAAEARVELKLADRISSLASDIRSLASTMSEARVDTDRKLSELKIALGGAATTKSVWSAAGATIIAGVALIGLSASQFGSGFQAAGSYAQKQAETARQIEAATIRLETIEGKISHHDEAEVGDAKPLPAPSNRSEHKRPPS
ncbi:MAG: hypothetical protein JO290_00720 [Sphingomonadaceae bacterium]|nr:hypothetical protein [Sphingomonadaceae bacterium]